MVFLFFDLDGRTLCVAAVFGSDQFTVNQNMWCFDVVHLVFAALLKLCYSVSNYKL